MTTIVQGWFAKDRPSAGKTLAQMARNVRLVLGEPLVWETAKTIVARIASRDEVNQARAIRVWVNQHFRFVKDPRGVELLETPLYLLEKIARQGFVQGDCDDAATLTAALSLAIGIPAKFVAVDLQGSAPGYDHVFAVAYPFDRANGRPVAVEYDITRPADLQHVRFKPKPLIVAA